MSTEKQNIPDFYRGDNWSAEESIGYLLRTTVSTLMRAAEAAMRLAEIAVVEHRATEEQRRRVQAMAQVHTRAGRRSVWMDLDRT